MDAHRVSSICLTILEAGADDAVICDLHESASDLHRLVSSGVPVTYVGGGRDVDPSVDVVGIDNTSAAREVARYLVGRDLPAASSAST